MIKFSGVLTVRDADIANTIYQEFRLSYPDQLPRAMADLYPPTSEMPDSGTVNHPTIIDDVRAVEVEVGWGPDDQAPFDWFTLPELVPVLHRLQIRLGEEARTTFWLLLNKLTPKQRHEVWVMVAEHGDGYYYALRDEIVPQSEPRRLTVRVPQSVYDRLPAIPAADLHRLVNEQAGQLAAWDVREAESRRTEPLTQDVALRLDAGTVDHARLIRQPLGELVRTALVRLVAAANSGEE